MQKDFFVVGVEWQRQWWSWRAKKLILKMGKQYSLVLLMRLHNLSSQYLKNFTISQKTFCLCTVELDLTSPNPLLRIAIIRTLKIIKELLMPAFFTAPPPQLMKQKVFAIIGEKSHSQRINRCLAAFIVHWSRNRHESSWGFAETPSRQNENNNNCSRGQIERNLIFPF